MSLVSSIFSQIMKLMPRTLFEEAVREHHAEKHTKGLSSWSQCIAMMFCHLGGARSLREVVGGLAASEGKLKHFGLEEAPARSSLAYANKHRPWEVYQTMFRQGGQNVPGGGIRQEAEVPLSSSSVELGFDHDAGMHVDVRLGQVHAHEGSRKAASGAG
jgi:hypothetical protein